MNHQRAGVPNDCNESPNAEEPIKAKLVDDEQVNDAAAGHEAGVVGVDGSGIDQGPVVDEHVRVGSPFAVDPEHVMVTMSAREVEAFYDVGPVRYTAMGAVAASTMVVGFAVAAYFWFPSGGALIAGLGCVLSIFGLYSSYRFTSAALLAVHLGLFVSTYFRSLG